ncbi:MAG: UDP-2,3-diacylglucosamine diphosphatase, partial [Rhodanobacteraceae bacterium]|nr:UDP-2,3-diacylglucosamine diphosphatase [Rhodanobacteraceae bacterium]
MGAVYFASDLHLTAVEDPVFGRFVVFCERVAADGSALYLLGDVFEAWVGDDDDAPLAQAVAAQLRRLADAGIDVAFMHGNRDFLVGSDFAARVGARLLGEVETIALAGRRVALLHGDTL